MEEARRQRLTARRKFQVYLDNISKYFCKSAMEQPQTPSPSPVITNRPRITLKFTGMCDYAEFTARCEKQGYWYHTFFFDNGFVQHGDYDIGRDIESYGFPKDMTGLSVLDVGTGSGWFATYFEQLGADVITVDVRGYCDFDVFGRIGYPDVATEKPAPDRVLPDGRGIYYSPVRILRKIT